MSADQTIHAEVLIDIAKFPHWAMRRIVTFHTIIECIVTHGVRRTTRIRRVGGLAVSENIALFIAIAKEIIETKRVVLHIHAGMRKGRTIARYATHIRRTIHTKTTRAGAIWWAIGLGHTGLWRGQTPPTGITGRTLTIDAWPLRSTIAILPAGLVFNAVWSRAATGQAGFHTLAGIAGSAATRAGTGTSTTGIGFSGHSA